MTEETKKEKPAAGSKKPVKKRKHRKALVIFALLFIALIAGILININALLRVPAIHDFVFRLINKSFYGRIYSPQAKAHLSDFDAEGWDVTAHDKDGREIARAPHVRIHFNPLSFFWGEVRLESMIIDKPVAHLWADADRVFVWKKFKKPSKKLHPIFRVRAGFISATDGTFTYDYYPEPRPVHVHLEGINATAKFTDKIPFIEGSVERLYLKYGSFDNWFEKLTVAGVISDDFTYVKKITGTYLNMPLEIEGRIDGFNTKNPRLNLNIKVSGKIGDLLRHFKYDENPPGNFALTGRVRGRSDDFTIEGEFYSPWGVVEGQRYDDFRATYTYHKNIIYISHFSMKMYGMRYEGVGRYNIETGEFSADGVMFHKSRPMKFHVSGRLDTKNDVMIFDHANVETLWARLTSSGKWYTNKGTLEFNYRLLITNMAKELPNWGAKDFAGKLDVSGKFSGPIRKPLVTAKGKVESLTWKRVLFGNGPVTATLKNGDLNATLLAVNGDAKFSGTAKVPILRNGDFANLRRTPFSFSMKAENLKLTEEITGTDFTGTLDGNLTGEGTTADLAATGTATLTRVNAWGQSIESIIADLNMDEKGIAFDNMRITLPGGDKGTGRIWMDWDFNYDLHIESDSVRLTSLNKVKKSDMPLTGTTSFKANGKGNFEKVHLEADITFDSLIYDTLDLKGGKLRVILDGTSADLDGSFGLGLGVKGIFDFDGGVFHDFNVLFASTPLEPIFKYRGVEDVSGSVTGNMSMNGGRKGWGDVDFRALFTSMHIVISDESITANGPARIEYGPSGGNEEIHLNVRGGNLDITGTISPAKVFDIDLAGEFDLSILTVFTTRVRRSSGSASLDAHLDGPKDNVKLSGSMALEGGVMKFRGYQAEFSELYGKLIFHPDRIKIEQLAGIIDDDGDFVLDGDILYKGFNPVGYDLAFLATGLPYSKTGEYKFVLSPDLILIGSAKSAVLRGEVEVTEGRYIKDFRIEKGVVELKRETAPRRLPPDFMKNLKLDVAIRGDGNFRVRNNLADLYLRIDLQLGGTPVSPTVDGSIDGVEGKVFYGGTIFDLMRLKADFVDRDTIDPEVDVFARTEIRDYEIRLYLKGLLSHMQLVLESVPSLDGQNILSLLTFGRLTEELSQSQSQILFNMPVMFDQFLGGIASRNIEKYTGFDIGLAENPTGGQGARVEVSMPLSKRITLIYLADTGGQDPLRQTRAVYKITDNLMIEGTQNNFGIYSFKLKIHFETE